MSADKQKQWQFLCKGKKARPLAEEARDHQYSMAKQSQGSSMPT
jgi:hypothetical protein